MTITNFSEIQTVRIICNATLKDQMLKAVQDLGATGYTYWDCHGKGRKEIMANPYVGASRIYIEIWCDVPTADNIVEYCNRKEFENHGVTAGKEPLLVHGQEANKFTKKA